MLPDRQLQKGKGPYRTCPDFLEAVCYRVEEIYRHELVPIRGVGQWPRFLQQSLSELHAELGGDEYFCIPNDDFGFHNVIVDSDWNITAIIDFDSVYVAPLSWALKPPVRGMCDTYIEDRESYDH